MKPENLLAVCRHYKVRPEWLVLGEEPRTPISVAPLDEELLEAVLVALRERMRLLRVHVTPAKEAWMIETLYIAAMRQREPPFEADVDRLLKIAQA